MNIIKAPTLDEITALIAKRDADFQKAIITAREDCISYINDNLSNHHWGTLKRLDYHSHCVEIPFDLFRKYLSIDPMYDLPSIIMKLVKPELEEAGYKVFCSTGAQKAIYFSLTPKCVIAGMLACERR